MNEAIAIALNVLTPVISVLVMMASALIAKKINDFFGLKNEEMLRDALHKAAENGLNYALNRGSGPVGATVIKDAVDYVKSKNPQTLEKLRVSDSALVEIIKSKISAARSAK